MRKGEHRRRSRVPRREACRSQRVTSRCPFGTRGDIPVRHGSVTPSHESHESREPDRVTTPFWLCGSGWNGPAWTRTGPTDYEVKAAVSAGLGPSERSQTVSEIVASTASPISWHLGRSLTTLLPPPREVHRLRTSPRCPVLPSRARPLCAVSTAGRALVRRPPPAPICLKSVDWQFTVALHQHSRLLL